MEVCHCGRVGAGKPEPTLMGKGIWAWSGNEECVYESLRVRVWVSVDGWVWGEIRE